nr:IS200/IS605 family transposase [Armatimonas sp.]
MKVNRTSRHQSKVESFSHFVWATQYRRALLVGEWEEAAHRCIRAEVMKLGGEVLALNGMPDHVHLLVRLPATVSIAQFANQIKGVSSALLNDLRAENTELFRWQGGYACFSLSRSHLSRVMAYIDNQKHHHANDRIWPEWEEVGKTQP